MAPSDLEFLPESAHASLAATPIESAERALDVFDLIPVARKNILAISPAHWPYLQTGSDDDRTVRANRDGFQLFQIRPRRLVDVRTVDTSVELFGQRYSSPIMLAPVGSQQGFHEEGEHATARAARAHGALMILSTVASVDVAEVAKEYQRPLWFQLYPTNDWEVTRRIVMKAERAGCPVLALTADSPVNSNRETLHRAGDKKQSLCQTCHGPEVADYCREHPIFDGMDTSRLVSILYPYTWELVEKIRALTQMKIVIKGIVTGEDADLCVRKGMDGIIVSNHGGRQEESLLSTIESLSEVVAAVKGRIPILIDSGFRRGTDVFKALALGADAICIGRPYIWGLGAFGQAGVERVLELMQAELKVTMQLAGTTSISRISPAFVRRRPRLACSYLPSLTQPS